jgi:hypothetical protein
MQHDSLREICDEILRRADIPAICAELGIELKSRSNGRAQARCPFHDDHDPSWSIATEQIDNSAPGHWTCFAASCGRSGNLFMLWSMIRGGTNRAAIDELAERFHIQVAKPSKKKKGKAASGGQNRHAIPPATIEAQHHALMANDRARSWLVANGISAEMIYDQQLGLADDRIVFHIWAEDGESAYGQKMHAWMDVQRATEPKSLSARGTFAGAYPMRGFKRGELAVVTEGELDALILRSAGVNALTCTGGVASFTAERFACLRGAGKVVVMIDQDGPSQAALPRYLGELAKIDPTLQVSVARLPLTGEAGEKDVRDYYRITHRRGESFAEAVADSIAGATAENPLGTSSENLLAADGQIHYVTGKSSRVVADWDGHLVAEGRDLLPDGREAKGFLEFELVARRTREAKRVKCGDARKLPTEILQQAGAEFVVEESHGPRLFAFLARRRAQTVDRVQRGAFFGWREDDLNFSRGFWSRSAIVRGGVVQPNREIEMVADGPLGPLDLAVPADDIGDVRRKFAAHAWYMHHMQATLPAFALAFLAPAFAPLSLGVPRFGMILTGRSATGKTQLALAVQRMFGPWSAQHLVTWNATTRALDHLLAAAGHSVLVIDDLKRGHMSDQEWKRALGVLHSVSEGRARLRLSMDGALQAGAGVVPRCLPIVTCESVPDGDEAAPARHMVVHLPAEDLDARRPHLAALEALGPRLPAITADYVAWLQQLEAPHRIDLQLESDRVVDRAIAHSIRKVGARVPNESRIRSHLRALSVGLRLGLAYLASTGAAPWRAADEAGGDESTPSASRVWGHWGELAADLAAAQAVEIRGQTPAVTIPAAIDELLSSRQALFLMPSDTSPPASSHQPVIGFSTARGHAGLVPGALVAALNRWSRTETWSRTQVRDALREAGWLAAGGEEMERQREPGGKRRWWVWPLAGQGLLAIEDSVVS